jgi:hypothetical protein
MLDVMLSLQSTQHLPMREKTHNNGRAVPHFHGLKKLPCAMLKSSPVRSISDQSATNPGRPTKATPIVWL